MARRVAVATARCTQACFQAAGTHAVLHPQGECWEREAEGQGWRTHHPGINEVLWMVLSVDGGAALIKTKPQIQRLLETSNPKVKTEAPVRNRECVGGLWGPIRNLCIKQLENELDQNSWIACLGWAFPLSAVTSAVKRQLRLKPPLR